MSTPRRASHALAVYLLMVVPSLVDARVMHLLSTNYKSRTIIAKQKNSVDLDGHGARTRFHTCLSPFLAFIPQTVGTIPMALVTLRASQPDQERVRVVI
jgi:hypothetical protein